MTFLPIVEREMRVAARRPQTQWLRLGAAVAALALVFVIFAFDKRPASSGAVSQSVFMALSVLAFGFALLAGVFLTADCVCSERRDSTLELLFLTDLKGRDIALGKLAATSLVASFAFLAIVPMLWLPLLAGGVSGGEVARMSLALVVTLLFSLSTGLLCSTLCRETRGAMGATFAVVLWLTGVLSICVVLLEEVWRWREAHRFLALSPLGAFLAAPNFTFPWPHRLETYWCSVSLLALMSLGQLVVTSWLLPRRTGLTPVVAKGKAAAASSSRASKAKPVLAGNPFLWLLRRERGPTRSASLLLWTTWSISVGCLLTSLFAPRNQAPPFLVMAFFSAFGAHAIFKALVAVHASRRLAEDRQSGALELLLATPLPLIAILQGQRLALSLQLGSWFRRVISLNVFLLLAVMLWPEHYHMRGEDLAIFCSMFIGGGVLLVTDFYALGWIGMFEGLRGQKQHRAVLSALGHTLLPGWLAILLFVFFGMATQPREEAVFGFFIGWAFGNALFAAILTSVRRNELLGHFRRLAAGEGRTFRRNVAASAAKSAAVQPPPIIASAGPSAARTE